MRIHNVDAWQLGAAHLAPLNEKKAWLPAAVQAVATTLQQRANLLIVVRSIPSLLVMTATVRLHCSPVVLNTSCHTLQTENSFAALALVFRDQMFQSRRCRQLDAAANLIPTK